MSDIPIAQPVQSTPAPVQGTVVDITPPPAQPVATMAPAPVQGTVVGVSPPTAQPTASPVPSGNEVDTFIANQQLYFFRYAPNKVIEQIASKNKETLFEMTKIYVMLVNGPTEIVPMLSIAPVEGWRNSVTGQVYYNYVNCGPDGYKNYMPKYDFSTQNVQMDCRYTLIGARAEVPEDGWKKLTNGILFKLGKIGNAALRSPLSIGSALGTGASAVGKVLSPIVSNMANNALNMAMRRGGRTRKHTKKNRNTRKHKNRSRC